MRELPKTVLKRENWLLTFNDMMTLIFTFFVLILSFSSVQSDEVLLAAESLNRALATGKTEGVFHSVINPFISPYRDRDIEAEKQKKALKNRHDGKAWKLKTAMLGIVGGEPHTSVDQIRNDITVNMAEATLFQPDSDLLHKNGAQILSNIADKIRDDKIDIRVECFDKIELSGEAGRAAVNMSVLRAGVITRYLIEQGRLQPRRLSAMGYGCLKDETGNGIKIMFRS